MELEEVLEKDPGPPPTYEVIFRVVADGRTDPNELSVPSWQPEHVILRVTLRADWLHAAPFVRPIM